MADLKDQTIKCKDCGTDFVWTASEQEFYQQKGFENPPARCPKCRLLKKQQRQGTRQMYDVTCAKCGKPTQVRFQPKGDRPVYCLECFKQIREEEQPAPKTKEE